MLIPFSCNNSKCNNSITKFFKVLKDVPSFLDCGACGVGKLERQLSAPSTKSTVMIDNGVQNKAVEVSTEIIEQEEQRALKK